ncbi:MAG: RluA family pseudouridine synthase [Clostridia bacterium]|nr:RluA family pseudouridine synthase [Clostridia bacterium]
MKEFTVLKEDDGRRADRWIKSHVPKLNNALIQKFLRLKRLKRNGKPVRADDRLNAGDVLNFYIEDEFFEPVQKKDKLLDQFRYNVNVVYEDENILLLDKRPGIICHPDENEKVNTLLTHARAYLYQKGVTAQDGFQPVLVNRIDRFTGGIVICAKNEEAMHILSDKIRTHEIEKAYLCVAQGRLTPPSGVLKGYIVKKQGQSRVRVSKTAVPGGQYAETIYKTLSFEKGKSLVECVLVTGRTHQIRSQLADFGHPLWGDTAYGAKMDEGRHYQALYSYKITFRFESDAGMLSYLNGKSVFVKNVPFASDFLINAAR